MTVTKAKKVKTVDERQFRSSSHREKVVEHVFLGELLRYLWVAEIAGVQVLKPEVDASGYDLVLSLGKVIRHVQLKTSMHDGKTQRQPVHQKLGEHASGCVVWIVLNKDLTFACFRWYGATPGKPLPDLTSFKRVMKAGLNAKGIKRQKKQVWNVPKSKFVVVPDMAALVGTLFGAMPQAGT